MDETETTNGPPPAEIVWQAFRHFVHLDESNAAIHAAPVRYSPLTFRLAEVLMWTYPPLDNGPKDAVVRQVCEHRGR